MKLVDAEGLRNFLNTSIVATLAVPVDTDGTLHIATLHYFHQEEPLTFWFVTQRGSEKCKLLTQQDSVKAACTIGTVPGLPYNVQMRGEAKLLELADNPEIMELYYQKRGSKNRNVEGEGAVIVQFTPDWARFNDFAKGWGSTMLELT
jgi:uncharacterized protein YhbP (UPF0306 family)